MSKKNEVENEYDFDSVLKDWAEDEKIKKKFEIMSKKPKKIARDLVMISKTRKLKEYCEKRIKGNQIGNEKNKSKSDNLSKLSECILDKWKEKGVKGLPAKSDFSGDLTEWLNKQTIEKSQMILDSLPPQSEIEKQEKCLKESFWNFKPEKFNLEKATEKKVFDAFDDSFEEVERENTRKRKKATNKKSKEVEYIKTHLHHLAFALYRTKSELESGHLHRKKYFEEISKVLGCSMTDLESEDEKYPKYLTNFISLVESNKNLSKKKLHKLICHISNLELKPLREYFNDESFQIKNGGDKLDEKKLKKIFTKWIFKLWRVTNSSGFEKQKSYTKLKAKFQEEKDKNIIDFWLDCVPTLTIPPYQSKNNRKPPKCQSLILNAEFLNTKYPDWQEWIKALKTKDLKFSEDYCKTLGELKSGKGKNYFLPYKESQERERDRLYEDNLNTRVLQFYFDRVKNQDLFNLNKIYAQTKKLKQMSRKETSTEEIEKQKNKVLSLIRKSNLPESLKTKGLDERQGFPQKSFLHLVCAYYKLRKRAKEGRIFVQPLYERKGKAYIKTNELDYSDHLLRYCHLKPRQKKHQLLSDLAHVLQVSPQYLEKIIGSKKEDKIVDWLKDIPGLSTVCQKSAKAQKEYKGSLNIKIQHEINAGGFSEKATKDKNKKDELFKLNESIKKASKNLGEKLFKKLDQDQLKEKVKKFENPFSFAQIEQIAFKERNGFSKTCKICSYDNALRMEAQGTGTSLSAKAQRLPAISTRLIDGAVRRLCGIFANAITKEKWENIEENLNKGNEVTVPLILEQNQFQFEPDLKNLKGKQSSKKERKPNQKEKLTQEQIFLDKEDRIKNSNTKNICPYKGIHINTVNGEIDHIIPRSSIYETLNDEANLIYASKEGNQQKGKIEYSLKDLSSGYKKSLFGDKTDLEIEQWIKKTIDDESKDERFLFGSYSNFVNLTGDQQKAFRHALFLDKNDPLRQKVIRAISNRNRSFVNGTQRYFAELIANKLYLKAKYKNLEKKLKFDYFGLDSQSNTYGLGIYYIRTNWYEKLGHPDFVKHKKPSKDKQADDKNNKKQSRKKASATREIQTQTTYSHLIDAQIAFMLAGEQHKNKGSMGLKIEKGFSVYPTKQEVLNKSTFFDKIKIKEQNCSSEFLERKIITTKDYKNKKYSHRNIWDENPGAWHFLKLIEIKEVQTEQPFYLKGFLKLSSLKNILKNENWKQKIKIEYANYAKTEDIKDKKQIIKLFKDSEFSQKGKTIFDQKKIGKKSFSILIYSLNKDKVAEFLLENFNTKSEPESWTEENKKIYKNLESLWYFTKKQKLFENNKPKILDLPNPQVKVFFDENNKKQFKSDKEIIKFLQEVINTLPLLNKPKEKKDFELKEDKPNKIVEAYKEKSFMEYKQSGYPKDCMKGALKKESSWHRIDIPDSEKEKYSKATVKEIQYLIKFDKDKIKCEGLLNPSLEYAWNNLRDKWGKEKNMKSDNIDFNNFLKTHFKSSFENPHQKVRKVFSLPKKPEGQGFYLIKRRNWNKKARPFIYQCQSVKDPGLGSRYTPYVDEKGDIHFKLADFLKNKNIVCLTEYNNLEKFLKIESKMNQLESDWYCINNIPDLEKEKHSKYGVKEIRYKLNKGNPYVKVFFDNNSEKTGSDEEIIKFLKKVINILLLLKKPKEENKIFELKKDKPNKIVEAYKEKSFIEYEQSGYPKGCGFMKGAKKVRE